MKIQEALDEIIKYCNGENQVEDGEDAEDALRKIETIARNLKIYTNFRLIEHAPELLEACEFVEGFFNKLENDIEKSELLRSLRVKFHAPIHDKLRPLIKEVKGL